MVLEGEALYASYPASNLFLEPLYLCGRSNCVSDFQDADSRGFGNGNAIEIQG